MTCVTWQLGTVPYEGQRWHLNRDGLRYFGAQCINLCALPTPILKLTTHIQQRNNLHTKWLTQTLNCNQPPAPLRMLRPHRGAYEYIEIAFKRTLHIIHRFTGYRKGDKGTKEIKKGRKEIKNEDVEECTPRLFPAVPSDLHTALLTKMFSHQGILSKTCCDTRCYARTTQIILLHRVINICHSSVGTVTVRVLISGKGKRFSLLRLWGQPTGRFKGCQRLLPRGVTLRLKLKVTWSSHIIQRCFGHSTSFFPRCAFGLCLVYVHE